MPRVVRQEKSFRRSKKIYETVRSLWFRDGSFKSAGSAGAGLSYDRSLTQRYSGDLQWLFGPLAERLAGG